MSAAGIAVTFGTISQAQSDVGATVSSITGLLDELRQYLAPLVATWEGGASSDYQMLQRRWDGAAGDLNMVLDQIRRLLGQSHDQYVNVETRAASAWG